MTDNTRDVYICPIDEQGCDSPDTVRLNLPPDADEKLLWDDKAVSIAISPDGQYLAAVFIRGLAVLWRLSDSAMLGYIKLAEEPPQALIRFKLLFSPDSQWLALSNPLEDQVLLWDVEQGLAKPEQVISPDDPAYYLVDMTFSPDSHKLVYQSWIGINQIQALVVWDIEQRVETQRRVIRGFGGRGVFIAQNAPWILATGNTSLAVWDSQQGAILDTLRTPERITETAVAEVGTTLHTASFIGDSVLPCRFEGSQFACDELLRHSELVQGAGFTPDAQTLVTISADGVIRHWDLTQRLVTQAVEIPPYPTDTVATLFSSDFSQLVTGGGPYYQPGDNTIRIWDTTSGQLLQEFAGHATRVTGLAFNPDETLLASIDDHSILRLWNVETGAGSQPVGTPPERLWNEFVLPTATFSPDGRLIAISQGNAAHLLSVDDLMQLDQPADTLYLTTLSGHSHRVRGLTFSADGTRLYTTGWDDTVRVWQVAAP
jgi:WD40 repeat protein